MPSDRSGTAVRGAPLAPAAAPAHARVAPDAPRAARVAARLLALAEGGLRLAERLLWPRVPRLRRGRPERIGILRVGLIGDTLAALPAIDALRQSHPDAELVLLTSAGARGRPGAAGLVDACPALDRLLVWHADEVAGPRGRLRLARRLRAERFDRVYQLPQELTTPRVELRNLVFLRLAGVRWVRGAALSHGGWLPGRLARAHHAHARFDPEWRRLLDLVGRAGATALRPVCDLGRSEASDAAAEALLAAHGLDPRNVLALGPGQNRPLKRWPLERFAAVGRLWIDAGGRVCVLGGPGESELGASLVAALGPAAVDLCGRADLPTAAALLRRVRALLSNDTGTMHLGAAVGCPTVAIFSGWDRAGSWLPFGDRVRALREPVPCAPCFATVCDRGGICLAAIEVDRAWAALGDLLATDGDPPAVGAALPRAGSGTDAPGAAHDREPLPLPATAPRKRSTAADR